MSEEKKTSKDQELTAPEKELSIVSVKPFTWVMGPEEDRREVSLRPIRLGDLAFIADSVWALFQQFSNSSGDLNLDAMGKGKFDKSFLILMAPMIKSITVVFSHLTGTDEDFIHNLELPDLSVLLAAFVEQNQVGMLIENFTVIASRVKEAMQEL